METAPWWAKQYFETLGKLGVPDNHYLETRDLITYSQPVTHTRKSREETGQMQTSQFILTQVFLSTILNAQKSHFLFRKLYFF